MQSASAHGHYNKKACAFQAARSTIFRRKSFFSVRCKWGLDISERNRYHITDRDAAGMAALLDSGNVTITFSMEEAGERVRPGTEAPMAMERGRNRWAPSPKCAKKGFLKGKQNRRRTRKSPTRELSCSPVGLCVFRRYAVGFPSRSPPRRRRGQAGRAWGSDDSALELSDAVTRRLRPYGRGSAARPPLPRTGRCKRNGIPYQWRRLLSDVPRSPPRLL